MEQRLVPPRLLLMGSCLCLWLVNAPAVFGQQPFEPASMDSDEGEPELPRYNVEILVFANLSAEHSNSEVWASHAEQVETDETAALEELDDVQLGGDETSPEVEEAQPVVEEAQPEVEEAPEQILAAELLSGEELLEEEALEPTLWYEYLPAETLQLTEIRERMLALESYQPLLHMGWVQPGYPLDEAQPFELFPETAEADAETLDEGTATEDGLAPEPVQDEVPPERVFTDRPLHPLPEPDLEPEIPAVWKYVPEPDGKPADRLSGTATLFLGRYLHLELDLAMEAYTAYEPLLYFAGERPRSYERYVLSERRNRLRSNQIHYFDHPKFGVLAQVWPHQEPVDESGQEGTQDGGPAPDVAP